MKTFRWLVAGAVVTLLAVFLLLRMNSGPRAESSMHAESSGTPGPVASAVLPPSVPVGPPASGVGAVQPPAARPFASWVAEYLAADEAQRAALLPVGESMAKARRVEMAELIRTNPEEAIHRALPYSVRQQLPENILSQIEQPLSARGEFRPVYFKPLPGQENVVPATAYEVVVNTKTDETHNEVVDGKPVTAQRAVAKKKTYQTYTFGPRLEQPAHRNAYLHGVTVVDDASGKDLLALNGDGPRLVDDAVEKSDLARQGKIKAEAICGTSGKLAGQSGPATVVQFGDDYYSYCLAEHARRFTDMMNGAHGLIWASGNDSQPRSHTPDELPPLNGSDTQGIKKLLYIRVLFADDPLPPQSDDGAEATAKANNNYFNQGSYNTVWWETTVTPLVRLPQRKNFYGESPGDLLGDAAAGAAALGYFSGDYYSPFYVLCNSLPQYQFGGLSSGILNGSPGALSHELGHNFGLPHANFWQPEGNVPGPVQPPNPQPPFPIDPDSLIGHNDLNAPYIGAQASQEYGNPHDVMGSGGGHFSAMFKNRMHWLPDSFIKNANGSTTNRIHAFDTARISEGRHYALRMRKDALREYWFSYRQGFPDNPWSANGLEVDWNLGGMTLGRLRSIGNNVLIDTTPDTTYGKEDASLIVGRTLNDPQANLYFTPIALGGGPNASDKWIDLVVQAGPFPGNQKPIMTLEASAVAVPNGATVSFAVAAQDADGDQLAYNWDFGDYTFGTNGPVQSKTFNAAGRYVVRCEVSDMKGGVASAHVVVTVGAPTTFTMSGRVLDPNGNPVQGVRVHNSGVKPANPPPAPDGISTNAPITDIGTYRYGYTDSDGYYVIGNVPVGTYTCRAFIYGYRTEPLDFTDPVVINSGNALNLNFVAAPLTRVSLTQTRDAFEPGLTEDDDGLFTITRSRLDEDYSQELKVRFSVSGTALINSDYLLTPVDSVTNVIVRTNNGVVRTFTNVVANLIIPAGVPSLDLRVLSLGGASTLGDGDKSVILTLLLQTNEVRVATVITNILTTNGNVIITNSIFVDRTNRFSIPGWELRPVGPSSTLTWYQTDPTYVIDGAEATVTIIDDDEPAIPTVQVTALDTDALESRGDSATLIFYRTGAPLTDDLVVTYGVGGGEAVNGLDCVGLSGTITIPAGQDFALLSVTAINDLFVEGNELMGVAVLPDPNSLYNAAPFTATVVIVDDDLPLVNIFAATAAVGRNSGGSARVTFSRAGSLDDNLIVNYLVTGTAVSGVDFNILPGSVIIPAGQLSVDVNITPIATSTNKLPRTVTVLVSDSTTYNIYNQNSATITLFESTLPTVTLVGTADAISEAGGTAAFTVTRTGPTTNSLNVFFEVGGSAWEGTDYGSIGTNIVIPVGSATASINITAINDNAREVGDTVGQDTVIVRLRASTNYNLGNTVGDTIRITDDDGSNLPSVGFMLKTSSVPEDIGLTFLYLKVTGNPETNKSIKMEYRVTSGTAVPNVNYLNQFPLDTNYLAFGTTGIVDITHYFVPNPPPMFFDFEAGIFAIPVFILDDGLAAGNKTLTLTLFNPTGYVTNRSLATNAGIIYTNVLITRIPTNAFVGPSTTHTITILDLATSTVTVEASATHAYEAGPQPAQFLVTRDGSTNGPLTVSFMVTGTAASGSDFVNMGTNGTVTIPAGTNRVLVNLTPIDDPTEEVAESVIFTLLPRTGYHVGSPDSATIILVSDDGTLQFTSGNYYTYEDDGGGFVPVVRTGSTNFTATVDYRFVGGTASNGVDYLTMNGTLTFLPGEDVQYIQVEVVDDDVVEPDETILLQLTNATGGLLLGGQKSTVLHVLNDDAAFEFGATIFRANENGGSGAVEILRRGLTDYSDSVTFTVSAGTNDTAGPADFLPETYTVFFLPGETNQFVQVQLYDDELFEGDETASLTLSDPSIFTTLGTVSNAVLLIVDDECQLDFAVTGFFAREYSNFVTLVVRRVGGTVNPVSVQFATSDVTATNGVDYLGGMNSVTLTGDHYETDTNGTGNTFFVPGESSKTITLGIIDDTLGEGDETFLVTLSNPQGPEPLALPGATLLGTNVTTVVTILDNETPGNVDYEFDSGAGANATVRSVALAPNGGLAAFVGRVVLGGDFTLVDGIALNRVARLLPSGALDASFNPGAGANSNVFAVAVQNDGRVLAGGDFTRMNNTNRLRLARLNSDGKLDLDFDLGTNGVNGTVRALALQTNGQVLIGGAFTTVSGQARTRVARLHTNGVLDTNFFATINGTVNALAVQADGNILIGGEFSLVNGSPRAALARLTPSGALDGSFAIGAGFDGPVLGLAVQADGQVVVAGAFTHYNGSNKFNLVRLDANGALDGSFQTGSGPDGEVRSVGVALNGKIVIGGAFTNFNGSPRARFARLNAGGTLDGVFNIGTGANNLVHSVAVQTDTAVLIGGDFTVVNNLPRNRIARIHGDEKLDLTGVEFLAATYFVNEDGGFATITVIRTGNTNRAFNVQFRTEDGTASSSEPQDYEETTDTLTFAAGELSKTFEVIVFDDLLVEGNETVNLFLTNASPGIDLSGATAAVLVIIDSAKTVSFNAGEFVVGEGGTNAVITLARGGNLSGEVTITFSTRNLTAAAGHDYTGITNTVTFTNHQAVATVLVPISDDNQPEYAETVLLQVSAPGTAAAVSPTTAVLSIIDNDPSPGGADTTFDPGAGATRFVRALALQPDGRLLVGGAFTNFASSNLNYLARLQTNGLVDPSFTPGTGPNALVSSIGLSSDGHIAIGGTFSVFNGSNFNRVVRLTTNGVADASFNQPMGFDAAINGLASQGDGKILAGGAFHSPASSIARLRVNGTFDLQFDPGSGADAAVHAVSLEADGKVLIGGAFTNVAGFSRPRLARLGTDGIMDGTFPSLGITNGNIYAIAPAPGGKILIGGSFRYVHGVARSGVARLNGDGSLDLSFHPGSGVVGTVYTVGALTNGAVFIGGDFVSYNGTNARRYALLKPDGLVDPFFDATIGADNTVYASVVSPEQTIVIGGDFTTVGGVARKGVARLSMGDPTVIRVVGPQVTGDQALLSINTSPGRAYVLEGSSDLLQWFSLNTNVATGVTLDFVDPGVSGQGHRFYRARRFGP